MTVSIATSSDQNFRSQCLQWIQYAGVALLCLTPIMMFLGTAVADIALTSIGVLFISRALLLNDFRFLLMRWFQASLLLYVYLLVISLFAYSPALSFKQAAPFIRFPILAAAMQCWLLLDTKHRRWFLKALGFSAILIALNTVFAFISGVNLTGSPGLQNGTASFGHWNWIGSVLRYPLHSHAGAYHRLQGINGKLNTATILTWSVLPFVAWMMMKVREREGLGIVLPLFSVLLISTAILLTGERMAFLEYVFGLGLLALFLPKWRKPFLLGFLMFALIVGVMGLLAPKVIQRVGSVYAQTHAMFHHNVYAGIFGYAIRVFEHHPLTGAGLKQFALLCHAGYFNAPNGCNTHAQNIYLEWLSGAGILGLLLFLSIIVCWFKRFWQDRALIVAMPIVMAACIEVVLRLWPLASTTSFFFSWGAIGFWMMGGLVLAYLDEQSDKRQLKV